MVSKTAGISTKYSLEMYVGKETLKQLQAHRSEGSTAPVLHVIFGQTIDASVHY